MTAPAARAASRAPGRVRAWLMTHLQQAAAGAGGVAIIAFAVMKKRSASPDAATGDAAATEQATDTSSTGLTAGLSGTPFTGDTDVYNQIQGQLNDLASAVNDKLANPTAPTAPTPAPAIPAPGASRYKIKAGDTLSSIAAHTMGSNSAQNMGAIKRANPVLGGWGATTKLDYFAGHVLTIPKPVSTATPAKPVTVRTPPKQPKKRNTAAQIPTVPRHR